MRHLSVLGITLFTLDVASLVAQTGVGPRPVLPAPDTTHAVAHFPRVVGWGRGERPSAPARFSVELFAAGLHSPRWVYVLSNGDLLVVESSNPGTPRDWSAPPEQLAARYASRLRGVSADRITILRDTTGDGRPDVRAILVTGLHQPLGVLEHGGFLYVANTDALVRLPFRAGQLEIASRPELVVGLPAGGYNNHWTRNVIAHPNGRKLYVSVGSATNVDVEGIDIHDERRAAILELDPDGRNLRTFARGLRNPVGMAWSATSELWTAVNERDGLGDNLPPDYVTRVQDGAFYGWPYAYFGPHEDPRHRGKRPDLVQRTRTPDYATGAHTATINLLFYRGSAFPARYRGGLFIAQRGSWNRSAFAGFRVAFLPFAGGAPNGDLEEFLGGFTADAATVRGRPIGLAELPDGSLVVSDDASGVLWRVRYAP